MKMNRWEVPAARQGKRVSRTLVRSDVLMIVAALLSALVAFGVIDPGDKAEAEVLVFNLIEASNALWAAVLAAFAVAASLFRTVRLAVAGRED